MKQFFISVFLLSALLSFAQESLTAEELEKKDWMHSDFSETGIYGVGDEAARAFLDSKGLQPQSILVAVLDSGVEIDHDDLKNNIWINPGEIAGNGIDDDNNGYVDDVYGWDFIGGKSGEDVNQDTLEMTRVFTQFTSAFESEDETTNAANKAKMPETYKMYLDAKTAWEQKLLESQVALERYTNMSNEFNADIDAAITIFGDAPINSDIIAQVQANSEIMKQVVAGFDGNNEEGVTFSDLKADINDQLQGGLDYFGETVDYYCNIEFDPRNIIGDNYENQFETNYGNNEVEGPDALHGTHVAGIIAAERNNGIGMDGIAGDVAKIMTVRTVPNGDERDKDVANSIRYAADNGAKIMNMSFGKDFSPYKEVVWQAMLYADRKGVLMFHAAGNDDKDVDILPNFPTNFREGKSFTKNWVTVGASTRHNDQLRASFSNYGEERVDLFAPGAEIYAPVIDNKYKFLQGTSMASPAAAGCAALLWAYFPELTATDVRDLLMQSVNTFDGVQTVGENEDQEAFNELSVSGGVIDVNKAARLAYEKYGNKKSVKK